MWTEISFYQSFYFQKAGGHRYSMLVDRLHNHLARRRLYWSKKKDTENLFVSTFYGWHKEYYQDTFTQGINKRNFTKALVPQFVIHFRFFKKVCLISRSVIWWKRESWKGKIERNNQWIIYFPFCRFERPPSSIKTVQWNLNSAFLLWRDTQFPAQLRRVGEDPGNEVLPSYLRSSGISKKGEGTFLHSQLYTTIPESVHIRL